MENEEDYPVIGKDINNWSELDSRLPILDLDIELFQRRNVAIASLVVLSALLKSDKQQIERLLEILTPRYFDPKSLPQYLFERISTYLRENESIPVTVLEDWIPEYSSQIWGVSPPKGRTLFGNNFTLRQIMNFEPSEKQVLRAIELRKKVMDDRGY